MKFYFPFSFLNLSVSCIVFLIPKKRQEYVVMAVGVINTPVHTFTYQGDFGCLQVLIDAGLDLYIGGIKKCVG